MESIIPHVKDMAGDKTGERYFYNLLRKRDKKAMEFLYDNYAPIIYGVIINSTCNEALSDELLAKTFRYIWNNHSEFDPDRQNICVWIINVARQMCKEAISFNDYSSIKNGQSAFASPDKKKLRISGLPAMTNDKKVFDLLFFGNGSLTEVAKHLGVSEADVMAKARDAIKQLRGITEKV